jgi:hypothetical protein
MIDQFILLAIKGVLLSTYAGSINVARKTSYHIPQGPLVVFGRAS